MSRSFLFLFCFPIPAGDRNPRGVGAMQSWEWREQGEGSVASIGPSGDRHPRGGSGLEVGSGGDEKLGLPYDA